MQKNKKQQQWIKTYKNTLLIQELTIKVNLSYIKNPEESETAAESHHLTLSISLDIVLSLSAV